MAFRTLIPQLTCSNVKKEDDSSHPISIGHVQLLRKRSTDDPIRSEVKGNKGPKPKPSELVLSFDTLKIGNSGTKALQTKKGGRVRPTSSNQGLPTNDNFKLDVGDFPDLLTNSRYASSPNTQYDVTPKPILTSPRATIQSPPHTFNAKKTIHQTKTPSSSSTVFPPNVTSTTQSSKRLPSTPLNVQASRGTSHPAIQPVSRNTQLDVTPKAILTSPTATIQSLPHTLNAMKTFQETKTPSSSSTVFPPNVTSTTQSSKRLPSTPLHAQVPRGVSHPAIQPFSQSTTTTPALQKSLHETLAVKNNKSSSELRDQAAFFTHFPVGKGRQKLTPKKKKLSSLKKHILLQRLERWKQTQESCNKEDSLSSSNHSITATTNSNSDEIDTIVVRLMNFILDEDSILDEDEFNECVSDLLDLANKIGPVKEVLIPQSSPIDKGVFVLFHHATDAKAAHACWNELVLSGQHLSVSLLSKELLIRQGHEYDLSKSTESKETDWKDIVLILDDRQLSSAALSDYDRIALHNPAKQPLCDLSRITLLLDNILSEEDFEDEECLEECMSDIIELVGKYGSVIQDQIHIERGGHQGQIRLVLEGTQDMFLLALKELNSLILGGKQVSAHLANSTTENNLSCDEQISNHRSKSNMTSRLILSNIFRDEDYEDEECFEETKIDVMRLLSSFGNIQRFDVKLTEADKGQIHVEFLEGDGAISAAVNKMNGMVLGGYPIQVMSSRHDEGKLKTESLLSNDKIIPEKYAECKRVPKLPFSHPRDYVVLRNDESVKCLLTEMLGELMRFQKRALDDKNAKSRRRLVLGFREVARGLRAHKIKMVVLASNCDQYDAVDDEVQDILALAKEQAVPIFFELNKRNIGKALGKTIKVSVVGIQNADGADAQFKSLKKISDEPIIT